MPLEELLTHLKRATGSSRKPIEIIGVQEKIRGFREWAEKNPLGLSAKKDPFEVLSGIVSIVNLAEETGDPNLREAIRSLEANMEVFKEDRSMELLARSLEGNAEVKEALQELKTALDAYKLYLEAYRGGIGDLRNLSEALRRIEASLKALREKGAPDYALIPVAYDILRAILGLQRLSR